MRMPPAMFGTTYFNFLASHDGIGLRSVENILEKSEIDALVLNATKANGKISYRTRGHISEAYEINISLFDAFKYHIQDGLDRMQNQRFICAHTIMLAMEGIPAFYIHSLLATKNDYKKLLHTSQNRSINRHQWSVDDLEKKLNTRTHHKKIFFELLRLIEVRKKQRAFHPNATQFTLEINESIFGLWRQSLDREQRRYQWGRVFVGCFRSTSARRRRRKREGDRDACLLWWIPSTARASLRRVRPGPPLGGALIRRPHTWGTYRNSARPALWRAGRREWLPLAAVPDRCCSSKGLGDRLRPGPLFQCRCVRVIAWVSWCTPISYVSEHRRD